MTENIENPILDLINRYLSGAASDEEVVRLREWMEESGENSGFYVEMAAIKSASETLDSGRLDRQRERMLQRLNARLSSEGAKPGKGGRRWLWGSVAAAAAVAAAVVMFALVHVDANESVQEEIPYISYVGNSEDISAVILEDGTRVWLNRGATLKYRTEELNRVAVLTGKAFFDVRKNSECPFVVKTQDLNVMVLGTSFIVETEETQTSVYLERGSVRLQTPEGVNLVRLHPDQKAVYNAATCDIEVESADVTPYLIRKYNSVSIKSASIPDIIRHIENIYGVRVSIESSYDPSQCFDLNYQRTDSIEQVLDIVRYLTGTHCRIATE